uniref:Uncharacterized protein n=1 Tax=Romanomermis culicivorax TaxID=13658 RepID=A0A915IUB1_ROMCU
MPAEYQTRDLFRRNYNIKCLVHIGQIEQWFTGAMGYWLQRPMEWEWVQGSNIELILKQLATSQFPRLGIVGFDLEKMLKAGPSKKKLNQWEDLSDPEDMDTLDQQVNRTNDVNNGLHTEMLQGVSFSKLTEQVDIVWYITAGLAMNKTL